MAEIKSLKSTGVQDECGILGIAAKCEQEIAHDVYFGLFALQHRGQESAGIALSKGDSSVAYYKNMGLVSEVFDQEKLSIFPYAKTAVGHVRYANKGSNNVVNAQPVVFFGRYGRVALSFSGALINAQQLKDEMLKNGHIFQSSVDSEVLASYVNYCANDDAVSGAINAAKKLVGAFAFVYMVGETLIAVRDGYGIKPLIMGERDGDIIFASESCALEALSAKIVRDVLPGEVVVVDKDRNISSYFFTKGCKKPCIFEHVYTARADSKMDGVSVYESRRQAGRKLAELYNVEADIVAGVPDSALAAAKGYSEVSGLPFTDALIKNRYIGRTFIQPSQAMRENSVKIKLSAFAHNIKGKRLVLIDDSIVRGTTSKKIITLLRQAGATEVHMMIASPMVINPCHFGVDMDTKEQLIANGRTEEEIRQIIGADSLHYLPVESLCEACGGKEYCTGCFDGDYSFDISGYYPEN
ncbi:MAG: amidophosphoribosyltransferase [Clostridia bacterium]|nr:amidophosphoribosyltransferase [Clostridia bacterium]